MAKDTQKQVIRSSGNVFADMGLPDADELGTKARLGAAINQIIARKRLSQAEVATLLAQLPQFAGEVFSFQCEICEVSTTCARILWPKAALSGDVAGAQAGVDWVDRCSVFAR